MTPEDHLKKYWNYDHFRPGQKEVITSILSNKDTLAIMPTGGGKSICYQISSLMLPGICIVVTPLIALMKDQVANLKGKGIFALAVHSGMNFKEVNTALKNAAYGNYKFLYVSPERLETDLFNEYLPLLDINLIAVDEAHCIAQWGYDFRPSYLKIAALREKLPDVKVLAVTASATPDIQKDICDKLQFGEGYQLFEQPYDRPNLSYSVFNPDSKETKLIEILKKVPGSSIVYCKTRKTTQKVAELLQLHHISADYYHAGLNNDERNEKQEAWIKNNIRVICCTNAFGMGIDKPDVRTVVHYNMPDALENYYQEAGRAGRDGKKSFAVLLARHYEILELKSQVENKFPPINTIKQMYGSLGNYFQIPAGKGEQLFYDFDITDFSKKFNFDPLVTINALKILEQENLLSFSEQFFNPSTIQFITSKRDLEIFEQDFPSYSPIIKGLLRSYEGIFDYPVNVDEYTLSRFLSLSKAQIIEFFKMLDKHRIIEYHPQKDGPQIMFLTNRLRNEEINLDRKRISKRKENYEKRLSAMINYAAQNSICRSKVISEYFSTSEIQPCGICDVCLEKKRKGILAEDVHLIQKSIDGAGEGITVEQLQNKTGIRKEKVLAVLQFLENEEYLQPLKDGIIKIKRRSNWF